MNSLLLCQTLAKRVSIEGCEDFRERAKAFTLHLAEAIPGMAKLWWKGYHRLCAGRINAGLPGPIECGFQLLR